jgi:transposase-like protein
MKTGSGSFAGFRFPPEVIVLAVRWYLRFGLSYRDLEDLLAERGITTWYRSGVNRSYNVLFKSKTGDEAQAQVEAFDDTWTCSQQAEALYNSMVQGAAPVKVA